MIEAVAACAPLVLGFHGYGGYAKDFFPDGFGEHRVVRLQAPGTNRAWSITSKRDVRTVKKLIIRKKSKGCVSAVIVVGYSMGAHFISNLVCETNLIDVAIPLAGATLGHGKCKGGKSTRWIIIHSRDDLFVPYNGKIVLPDILPVWTGIHRYRVARTWAKRNHCSNKTAIVRGGEKTVRWKGCKASVTLRIGSDWNHSPPPWFNRAVANIIKKY